MRIHEASEHMGDETTYAIYALTEPGDTDVIVLARIRYVGKTKNPDRRFRNHLVSARRGIRTHCYNWIRQLFAVGLAPNLEVLCSVGAVDADRVEKETIARFRNLGAPLTNLTDGGEGTAGCKLSPETRANMSAAHIGKKLPLETRAKLLGNKNALGNKSRLGQHISDETRAKLRGNRSRLGQHPSDETRAKLSAAMMGKKNSLGHRHSEESRAKMSAARIGNKPFLGHHHSDETRAKLRGNKNALGHHPSDETKLKMSAALRAYWATKED